ncbi:MAG: carboxylesterase family protein, partial [Haliscomenobacter sp.]
YFVNFIKTGNPNGGGLPQWPTIQSSKPAPVMIIDVNSQTVPDRFAPRYELLENMSNKKK